MADPVVAGRGHPRLRLLGGDRNLLRFLSGSEGVAAGSDRGAPVRIAPPALQSFGVSASIREVLEALRSSQEHRCAAAHFVVSGLPAAGERLLLPRSAPPDEPAGRVGGTGRGG